MAITGVWTALITPFTSDGKIDKPALYRLFQMQLDAKISGIILSGTTGESPTLSLEEKKDLTQEALQFFKGTQTQVGLGTGSNNTNESIRFSAWAAEQGVPLLLVVCPYYNKPSQSGLLQHFTSIADAIKNSSSEVMLYNVPGRTSISLSRQTICALSKHSHISSLKEATGDLAFDAEILHHVSSDFSVLSGDDPTFLPFLSIGGKGVVSVASNIIPEVMVQIYDSFQSNDIQTARKLFLEWIDFFKALFIEANPVPVKYLLSQKNICLPLVRQPLAPLSEASIQVLQKFKINF